MDNGKIVVLDSGIGGLSVLKELQKKVYGESFVYFGDNLNAPYGNKSKKELLCLTVKNLLFLPFDVKAIVLACNTLSVTIRKELESLFNVPVFGVFPPYQKCFIEKKKSLIIATKRTAKELEREIGQTNMVKSDLIKIVGLESLALEIENLFPNIETIDLHKHFINLFDKGGINGKPYYERVILGCTHYNLIEKQIFNYFRPLKTISGIDCAVNKINEWLNKCSIIKNTRKSQVIFCGNTKEKNKMIFSKVVKESLKWVKNLQKYTKNFKKVVDSGQMLC